MQKIRRAMSRELAMALQAREHLGPGGFAAVAQLVADLRKIKRRIEDRAQALGYSARCRQAIPTCAGECCRRHFPRTINRVDFLIALFGSSAAERKALVKKLQAVDLSHQCPLLRADGCILSFANRPMVCTNAFPCFAGEDYWRYKETFRDNIEDTRAALNRLINMEPAGDRVTSSTG